jgi:tRNA A37 threonylcarbamoyltransferase TsaD
MNSIPIQNVVFDDTATSAMGEAFDKACKSLRNLGTAVPEIIANRIIAAAKDGERDAARLYEQALKTFGIEETSMQLVSVGRDPPVPTSALVTHAA